MNSRNLHFFGSDGYELNFNWNDTFSYWEGSIYLPKVSVGLYANTSIYILEEIPTNSSIINTIKDNTYPFTNTYSFPTGNDGDKITFTWDRVNSFVDEFFMFEFNKSYTLKETSSLVYTPNDGPDCDTLIINRFDTYDIDLSTNVSSKALPVHIAFIANEKYDATTYNRTLMMYYNNTIVAKITFYEETVEEDERLKIWNSNLGYNITPEDEMIFFKSDIKEYKPNYILLNEKRKELMMEGSNIYPYIGSYKAIINAIKFFGYENLNIIEYWRNVNPDDENFGKIYHSSKYSLTNKETLTIGSRNIVLPNKDYKKINALALVYSINEPTGDVDELELPKVKEKFTYTIEEALIKLFALRKKLNKEFMPGTSRIIDIIGEANYFGIHGLNKVHDEYAIDKSESIERLDFEIYPSKYVHITDNEYFNRYIKFKKYNISNISPKEQLLSDIYDINLNTISSESVYSEPNAISALSSTEKCDYFKNYYKEVFVDYTVYKAIENNDSYPFDSTEYKYYTDYNGEYPRYSAKVVISNTSFSDRTFDNCELKFDCKYSKYMDDIDESNKDYDETKALLSSSKEYNITFDSANSEGRPSTISWKISMSKDQTDEELKNIGIIKKYEYHDLESEFNNNRFIKNNEDINLFNQVFFELPYVGYYDVTMTIGDKSKTKTKAIKVEPYNIELIGFYYDARELPDNIKYDNEEDSIMYNFIQDNIKNMHGWATSERTELTVPTEFSMPIYSAEGEIMNTGPYFNANINNEWYLADNVTFEIAKLSPLVKYTRYIKNGVDVKPYTWFLLSYEYSKIAGKTNPKWTIIRDNDDDNPESFEGRYLTLLLKKEGNYTVKLSFDDKNGNTYEITRNIIVVSKKANYNIYQTFKKDYDYYQEQEMLKELNEFNTYYSDDNPFIES